MPKSKKPRAGLHFGHRKRMRKRYLKHGFNDFSDHEVLEFLLYFSIPRSNTNEIAHLLLNRHRKLSNVLNADPDDLKKIAGIGDNSAILLNMIPKLFARYELDRLNVTGEPFTEEKIKDYLQIHYLGETVEHSVIMLFNAKMQLIECVPFDLGTTGHCTVDYVSMARYVVKNNVDHFAVAHNHPYGSTTPSDYDKLVTKSIYNIFNPIGKHLIDHYIVTDNEVVSINKAINGG